MRNEIYLSVQHFWLRKVSLMETVHDCHLCSHFTLSNLKSTEMKDIFLHAKFIWTNPNALREYWTYEGYYALKSGYSLLACVYWFPNWSEKSSNICNGTCMLEKIISFDQNARKENWFNQDTFNCYFYTLMLIFLGATGQFENLLQQTSFPHRLPDCESLNDQVCN